MTGTKEAMRLADAVHELNELRRGRGVNTVDPKYIGPRLRKACSIIDVDTPAQVRRKVVAHLQAWCAELPIDLQIVAKVAFALHDQEGGEFLNRREAWLATYFDRDRRTIRRRINVAFRLLGERIDDQTSDTP